MGNNPQPLKQHCLPPERGGGTFVLRTLSITGLARDCVLTTADFNRDGLSMSR